MLCQAALPENIKSPKRHECQDPRDLWHSWRVGNISLIAPGVRGRIATNPPPRAMLPARSASADTHRPPGFGHSAHLLRRRAPKETAAGLHSSGHLRVQSGTADDHRVGASQYL